MYSIADWYHRHNYSASVWKLSLDHDSSSEKNSTVTVTQMHMTFEERGKSLTVVSLIFCVDSI